MTVKRRESELERRQPGWAWRCSAIGLGILAFSVLMVSPLRGASLDQQVREIAAELRCPVCQGLSVADSPAGMANQMRDLIRERLQAGESPQEIKAYFVERYGEWILLAPKKEGFNLLVWLLPFLGLTGGAAVLFVVLMRWQKRTETAPDSVDAAYLERVRREMAQDQS